MLTVAVARSSSEGNAMRFILPVLWMTSCFHIMQEICWNQRQCVAYVSSSLPGGGTGVSDCILFFCGVLHCSSSLACAFTVVACQFVLCSLITSSQLGDGHISFQFVFTDPPNGSVLFCWLASVVVCRRRL